MSDARALRLIAITDAAPRSTEQLVARMAAAVRGGATMVQLRRKDADARTLVELARALVAALPEVPVLVNDRVDVALAAGAAGAHVGSADLPVAAVRRIAPPGFLIGASVGSEGDLPGALGADYVGIGPVFATASKDDAGDAIGVLGLAALAARCGVPAVAIGGITMETARSVMGAGVAGVAVIQALFGGDDPERAARALRRAIGR